MKIRLLVGPATDPVKLTLDTENPTADPDLVSLAWEGARRARKATQNETEGKALDLASDHLAGVFLRRLDQTGWNPPFGHDFQNGQDESRADFLDAIVKATESDAEETIAAMRCCEGTYLRLHLGLAVIRQATCPLGNDPANPTKLLFLGYDLLRSLATDTKKCAEDRIAAASRLANGVADRLPEPEETVFKAELTATRNTHLHGCAEIANTIARDNATSPAARVGALELLAYLSAEHGHSAENLPSLATAIMDSTKDEDLRCRAAGVSECAYEILRTPL